MWLIRIAMTLGCFLFLTSIVLASPSFAQFKADWQENVNKNWTVAAYKIRFAN